MYATVIPRQTDRDFAARRLLSISVATPPSTVSYQNFRLSILATPTIHEGLHLSISWHRLSVSQLFPCAKKNGG